MKGTKFLRHKGTKAALLALVLCGLMTGCANFGVDEREWTKQCDGFQSLLNTKHAAHNERMASMRGESQEVGL